MSSSSNNAGGVSLTLAECYAKVEQRIDDKATHRNTSEVPSLMRQDVE